MKKVLILGMFLVVLTFMSCIENKDTTDTATEQTDVDTTLVVEPTVDSVSKDTTK